MVRSRVLEGVSAGVCVAALWFAAAVIPALPAIVPTHFGWNGAADRTGPSTTLWMLPVLVCVLYLLIGLAGRLPQRWLNYPVKVTDRNRDAVYALGREMLPALKAASMLTLFVVEWGSFDATQRGAMSPYFNGAAITMIALIIAVLAYYTRRMRAA